MKRHAGLPAIFAMVTVAFLFGLAPVFHAVCFSALEASSTSPMSHIMGDGTVMNMSSDIAPEVMNMDTSESKTLVAVGTNQNAETANILGTIMITAGLSLLTFLGLRYYTQVLARRFVIAVPEPIHKKLSRLGQARARPPSQVDLNALCISRT
ncbi:hypothetical protein M2118_001574 [Aurantimicrobium minutum]|uniref:hypothetical protein n=1 Tax=Aurantimicrobium minutum TaxID=708131 RepID=UPI0024749BCC|nr:hypothetical protein [Aurantimicrobium minutum]MDH6278583.1 hypothetical protein [Aurantimicrobium minutum]